MATKKFARIHTVPMVDFFVEFGDTFVSPQAAGSKWMGWRPTGPPILPSKSFTPSYLSQPRRLPVQAVARPRRRPFRRLHGFATVHRLQAHLNKSGHLIGLNAAFLQDGPGGVADGAHQDGPAILQDLGQVPPPLRASPGGGAGRSSTRAYPWPFGPQIWKDGASPRCRFTNMPSVVATAT